MPPKLAAKGQVLTGPLPHEARRPEPAKTSRAASQGRSQQARMKRGKGTGPPARPAKRAKASTGGPGSAGREAGARIGPRRGGGRVNRASGAKTRPGCARSAPGSVSPQNPPRASPGPRGQTGPRPTIREQRGNRTIFRPAAKSGSPAGGPSMCSPGAGPTIQGPDGRKAPWSTNGIDPRETAETSGRTKLGDPPPRRSRAPSLYRSRPSGEDRPALAMPPGPPPDRMRPSGHPRPRPKRPPPRCPSPRLGPCEKGEAGGGSRKAQRG